MSNAKGNGSNCRTCLKLHIYMSIGTMKVKDSPMLLRNAKIRW